MIFLIKLWTEECCLSFLFSSLLYDAEVNVITIKTKINFDSLQLNIVVTCSPWQEDSVCLLSNAHLW